MKKQNTTSEPQLRTLLDVAKRFPTEQSCRDYLEQIRWNGKPVCVHCGNAEKIYRMKSGSYKCAECRKPFSIKVGTFFEDSALPLQKWFFAIFILTAHKKGIASTQLARDIGVTQKTAWFMLHRIRQMIRTKSFNKPLENTVEADETYIGGKNHKGKRGRGSENKTPVFGMIERKGELVCMPVERVDSKTLVPIIENHVSKDATVMTDEWVAYNKLDEKFEHQVINHGKQEYVRGEIHVNTIEGFWSLLKRGIVGIYHHVSEKHLHRYCDEFEYRYNTKIKDDVDRFGMSLGKMEGRLTYKELIDDK